MKRNIKIHKQLNKLLKRVPMKPKYWLFLDDQKKYIRAKEKIFKNSEDRKILEKYKYTGIPSICPNYKKIVRDYPKINQLLNL